mmetsp:Transcript_56607/g.138945  ORF Transcript_56607/g.138945 Transcript_56607/m.138945 type:complete len:204 (-) Transcript_56607:185-796(-)
MCLRVAERPKSAILMSGSFWARTTSKRPLRVLSTQIWRSGVKSFTPPEHGAMASSFLGKNSLSIVMLTSFPVPCLYCAAASLSTPCSSDWSDCRQRSTTAGSIIWYSPWTVSLVIRSLYAAFELSPILPSSLATTALTLESTSSRDWSTLRREALTSFEKAMRFWISICLCLRSNSVLTLTFSCSTSLSFSMLNSSSALMRIS